MNNRAIKYALKANKIEEADNLIKLFLRDPSDGNAFELQTMWYELELAYAYFRSK